MNFQYPIEAALEPADGEAADLRAAWRELRAHMEDSGSLHSFNGPKSTSKLHVFRRFVSMFNLDNLPSPLSRLHDYLVARTRDIALVEHRISLPRLPPQFDGYRLVHLSDPHFDSLPGLEDSICERLSGVNADAMVITGDLVDRFFAPAECYAGPLKKILGSTRFRDGVFAVLGNHDSWKCVEVLESLGIRVLVNESAAITRDGGSITVTGIDDPSYFYTGEILRALRHSSGDSTGSSTGEFKVLLAHSPDLADLARDQGYGLYLAGHTHGGQICLPNGKALHVSLERFRDFGEGPWNHDGMAGFTNIGAGTSILPYRLFKRGEVVTLTLRRSQDPSSPVSSPESSPEHPRE